MRILYLTGNIYLNKKTLIKNIFGKFACIFINAVTGWNFNILYVLGQMIFPSSTLSEGINDYQLNVKPYVYLYKTTYNNASVVLNVATYWLALPFISLVNNVSVIISKLVTKMMT